MASRLLADADVLAADDPLRRAARADLFAAVTSGPLADGALAALDQVSRHSPLGPWKLLIRALDAYYRRADGVELANLDAIPPRAAPARLVPVLRHLIGEAEALDQRSPAAGALLRVVEPALALQRRSRNAERNASRSRGPSLAARNTRLISS